MELRQLKYFDLICKNKNFTKAAKEAYISQPSITNAIKNLEAELNVKLFDRGKKEISLTSGGVVFSKRVKEILSKVDYAISEVQDFENAQKNTITIGITPLMGVYYFPEIFSEFKKLHPEISLNIVEKGSNTIKRMLQEKNLDMGLGIIDNCDDLFDTHTIIEKQLCLCVSENNPLSKNRKATFQDMKNLPFVLYNEGSYIRDLIFNYFKINHFEPKVAISTNQLETIKNFVTRDLGVAFMFENSIEKEDQIESIPLETPLFMPSGLISVKDKYLSTASQVFIDYIKNYTPSTCG